ncbi:hypothetical protein M3Y97_01111800 [Aphelenchoides bicaudatus]|nr:hypothetical protein M3Y97_01111800 [Aphelenchoides bicaudatus]
MKVHQLQFIALLFILYTWQTNGAPTLSENDDEGSDHSLGQEVEFRQPLYMLKRDPNSFWQFYFRPSGYPQPSNYGQMFSELKDPRNKRATDNPTYKKMSRETARLRQRFYNLLR